MTHLLHVQPDTNAASRFVVGIFRQIAAAQTAKAEKQAVDQATSKRAREEPAEFDQYALKLPEEGEPLAILVQAATSFLEGELNHKVSGLFWQYC